MKSTISRRSFLKKIGLAAAALTVPGCNEAFLGSNSKRPNFVIIFTDDQGYADVGKYGAKDFTTPNLDKMADEGVRFTDFYVAASSCSPSRAALMTGCYPQRVGIPFVLFPERNGKPSRDTVIGLNKNETTIAEVLKSRGYATACVGKWHLGHHKKFLPTHHGFDGYFGLPYSNDMRPENSKSYPPLPLIDGDEPVELNPDQTYLTTRYTERAVDFIEKNKDKPFFLYLAHSMPHVPLYVSDKFKGKSEQGMYGDVIMEIDWSVGQVMDALKRNGIDDNTLVFFTCDNGPWIIYGNHAGSAGPLREAKGTSFDGGQRVPAICRWPGKIPAGSVCSEPVVSIDLLPTFAEFAGAKPVKNKIDGKDIRALLMGKPGAESPHEAIYFYRGWVLEGVRSGKWKLHLPHSYRTPEKIGNDGKGGKYTQERIGLSLFNLEQDIGEQNDVSDQHPEVVERLLKLADKMRQDLGDKAENIRGTGKRKPGKI